MDPQAAVEDAYPAAARTSAPRPARTLLPCSASRFKPPNLSIADAASHAPTNSALVGCQEEMTEEAAVGSEGACCLKFSLRRDTLQQGRFINEHEEIEIHIPHNIVDFCHDDKMDVSTIVPPEKSAKDSHVLKFIDCKHTYKLTCVYPGWENNAKEGPTQQLGHLAEHKRVKRKMRERKSNDP
ncbi:hypothetical protein EJB05_27913 [Eragrostis curvula]|uniref:Uncharacterized protein n=1 Tax=Eragrostis curvula TaxID=38414 RepID=A0A5J9UPX0_9POAL|nr:hypothetical protein EJB05_27913 [Eragrostis curvula]